MAAINHAYQILGDPESRRRYDELGLETATPSRDEAVHAFLRKLFEASLSLSAGPEGFLDPIEHVRNKVSAERRTANREISAGESAIAALRTQRSRVTRADGKPNAYVEMIDAKIAEIERKVEAMRAAVAMASAVLDELKQYQGEPAPQQPCPFSTTTNGHGLFRNQFRATGAQR